MFNISLAFYLPREINEGKVLKDRMGKALFENWLKYHLINEFRVTILAMAL